MNAAVVAFPDETVAEFAARIVEQAKMTTNPHGYVQAWHHALTATRARFAQHGADDPAHQVALAGLQAQIDALAEVDARMERRVQLLEAEVDGLLEMRRP